MYALAYDEHDRMTEAKYYQSGMNNTTLAYSGDYDVNVSYDKRGNIKTLKRQGLFEENGCLKAGIIDDLEYIHDDNNTGNQLRTVVENAPMAGVACPPTKNINTPINSNQTHQVSDQITANSTVNGNNTVNFYAGNQIQMNAGFQVTSGGGIFTATIQGCEAGDRTEGFFSDDTNNRTYEYDANGNLTYDPNKRINIEYNHLDLPRKIIFEGTTKELRFTYDATGNLLTRQAFTNGTSQDRRDYINGLEYHNNSIESIYHEQGRVNYINGSPRYEYFIKDHLGNTRLVYSDLDNDGFVKIPEEILQENHYYPYGLQMNGNFMQDLSEPMAYAYNGIEQVDVAGFELGVNMAFYRTLDPALGQWWSVDPLAVVSAPMSPYCAMNASPFMYNDPQGDLPIPVITGLVGAAGNIIYQGLSGNLNSPLDVLKAGGVGFVAGAAGGLVGQAVVGAATISSLGQAVASGIVSGGLGGYAEGFIRGLGNLVFFNNGDPIRDAFQSGVFGAAFGGIAGGFTYKGGNNSPVKDIPNEDISTYPGSKPPARVGKFSINLDEFNNSAIFDAPKLPGSGPVKGVIEVSASRKSVQQFLNWNKKGGIEFVFDSKREIFALGRTTSGTGSPHERLMQSINSTSGNHLVGGTVSKNQGRFIFTENSGHYGANWNPQIRKQFSVFMKKMTGINVNNIGFTK